LLGEGGVLQVVFDTVDEDTHGKVADGFVKEAEATVEPRLKGVDVGERSACVRIGC
jgi:hypothetical protein